MKKVITLGLDYSDFTNGITNANAKLRTLDNEFKLTQASIKGCDDESKKIQATITYLQRKIELQTEKVNASREAFEKAQHGEEASEAQQTRLYNAYIKNSTELAKLNNAFEEQTRKLDELNEEQDEYEENLNSGNEMLLAYADSSAIVSKAIQEINDGFSSFMETDLNMGKVATIADTNAVSIEKLRQGVYDIAKDTKQSSQVVSDALYQCISSNVKTQDSLLVTKDASNLAKAGFTDTSTAVDALTTIMNSYKMKADEVVDISDKLIITQKLGKTTVGEMGFEFGKVAGLASQAGISLNEVLAVIATGTQVNGSAAETLTGLRSAISSIIKPSSQAKETAKELGLEFNATALQSKGFAGFLDDVKEKSKGNIETMAKLFGNVNAVNSMLVVTGTGAETFSNALDEISNSSGATDKALNNMHTTTGSLQTSINAFKIQMVELVDKLSPLLDIITGVASILANIPTSMYILIIAIGALIGVVNALSTAQKAWTVATGACATAQGILAGTTELTAASMGTLLLVIVAIVAVIALLVGGWNSVTKSIRDAKSATEELTSATASTNSLVQKTTQEYGNQAASKGLTKYNANGNDDYEGGYTWVGESGPELVKLPSHSKIYSSEDSSKFGNKGDTYYVTIDAKNVKEFNDIVRMAKEKKQAIRRG